MIKRIIETPKVKKAREEMESFNSRCPCCGETKLIGGGYHTEYKGFFFTRTVLVHSLTCFKCGCSYEYEEEI